MICYTCRAHNCLFQAEDGIRDYKVTGVQTCALPIFTRIVIGYLGPLVLSWMIWRTLLIPHTMAATGLFYIALLGVFVGEILSKIGRASCRERGRVEVVVG